MPGPTPRKRRRWFRLRHVDLGEVIAQTLAAFFGVLMALMFDNWRERNELHSKLDAARAAIHSELSSNREVVQQKLDYLHTVERNGVAVINGEMEPVQEPDIGNDPHKAELLRAAEKSVTKNVCMSIPGYHGFDATALPRAAWDGAQAAGVLAAMDYAECRLIAAAYTAQHEHSQSFDRNIWLMQKLFDSNDRFLCVMIAREQAFWAGEALDAYDAYLGKPPSQ